MQSWFSVVLRDNVALSFRIALHFQKLMVFYRLWWYNLFWIFLLYLLRNSESHKRQMKEECLICQTPLEYLEREVLMECELCHRQEMSNTRCVNGHYVCNECHTKGVGSVVGYCMKETSSNPVEILDRMMDMPFCHMHGPEHHTLVGASQLDDWTSLVAYRWNRRSTLLQKKFLSIHIVRCFVCEGNIWNIHGNRNRDLRQVATEQSVYRQPLPVSSADGMIRQRCLRKALNTLKVKQKIHLK